MMGKIKWKPSELLSGKILSNPGGTEEISATIKGLKDTSPLKSTVWHVQKTANVPQKPPSLSILPLGLYQFKSQKVSKVRYIL